MRKLSLIALSLLLGIGWTASGADAPEPTPFERLVPAGAVAFARADDLPGLRAAFERSALAQAVRSSRTLSYFLTAAGAATDFAGVLLTGLPADELRNCFGRRFGVVLLDFKSPEDMGRRPPVALLAEVTDPQKVDSVLARQLDLLSLLRPELTVGKREHAGTTVHELGLPAGGRIAGCVRNGVLVVGSARSVDAILDHSAANGACITAAPGYQAVRRHLGDQAGILAYLNARALMMRFGIENNPLLSQRLRGVGVATAQAVGLAIDFDGAQVRERAYLHTGGAPTGVARLLTEGAPVALTLQRFVPADFTLLATMALKDVGMWDRLRSLLVEIQGEGAASIADTVAMNIQQSFGVRVKEGLLDAFTDELLLAVDLRKLNEFRGSGRQPTARQIPVLFAARLRDAAILKDTIAQIAANERLFEMGVEHSTTDHDGVPLSTYRIPGNDDIRPSYAILDGVFLVSLRPEPVAAAIDAYKSKKALDVGGQPAPCHFAVRLNDGQLLSLLLGLIREEPPAAAKRLLPEIDGVLAGLHGYSAVLRREPEGFSLETHSDLGTIGTGLAAAIIEDQTRPIIVRRVQADFDQIAAALEKYREKNNVYPATLQALVPDYVPELRNDRFAPKLPYGYTCGRADATGRMPDAWLLVSVGPDDRPNLPLDQFDPPAWAARLRSEKPEDVALLKTLIYQFRKDLYSDERKNDDEGDLFRMGGRGLGPEPAPAPAPTTEPLRP